MRRAQSVRNHMARPSLALAADDLGVLREGDESNEDVLRKQLIEKDRECDRLNMTIHALKQQLDLRPPAEEIKKLKEEQQSLDVLMLGYQRENEKSMAIIEQLKSREKLLERELTRLAGDNWRAALEIPPSAVPAIIPSALPAASRAGTLSGHHNHNHHRSNTISISSPYSHSRSQSLSYSPGSSSWMDTNNATMMQQRSRSPSPSVRQHQRHHHQQQSRTDASYATSEDEDASRADQLRVKDLRVTEQQERERERQEREREERDQRDAAQRASLAAQIEQMRVFILGMEKRLDGREEKLGRTLEKAENESRRYEEAVVAATLQAA